MNKGHVTPLLADYLDGTLPPGEAAAVKEHLAGCAGCREELGFLKTYLKRAADQPRVPVPDDFLEKIHARIDAPARGGLLRALFLPLKIKLPLEAAGALAVAAIAVLVFKPFAERKIEYRAEAPAVAERDAAPPHYAHKEAAPARGDDAIARDESRARRAAGARYEEKAAPADAGRISVANGAESAKTAASDDRAGTAAPADMSLVLAAVRSEGEAPGTGGAAARTSAPPDMITSLQKKDASAARAGTAASEYPAEAEARSASQARLDVIARQAQALGGRIVSISDAGAPGSRRLVVAEIPAKNYARFLSGIRGAWSVRRQSPAAPPARATLLRLSLSLQE